MNAERWRQIDIVFQQAVELGPDGRAAFLDDVCSDDAAFRAEVESLLVSDSRQHNFIDDEVLWLATPLLAYDPPRLTPGDKLAQYEIAGLIGRGGMGEVYLAKDETLNRRATLKLLPDEYTTDSNRLRRFQQEALAASALNHPNILTIYELRELDGFQFMAAEFIDGPTLREEMSRGKLPLSRVLDIAIQAAGAISAAHQAGIIHRDIKPENIMLRPDGYVKVLDFGLAKLKLQIDSELTGESDEDAAISSGLVMGTVKYMSPEQALGLGVDPRSDIFSLGAVLFEMVTGTVPFPGKDAAEIVNSLTNTEAPSLTNFVPDAPPRLVTILRRALAKHPESRYAGAGEFVADLKTLRHEIDFESRRPKFIGAVRRGSKRFAAKALGTTTARVVSALLLVAILLGIAIFVYLPRKRPESLGAWTTKAPLSRRRAGAAVAALNDQVYVVSGFNESGATTDVDVYHPATNEWSARAPLPSARSYVGAAAINGKLYVFGGCGQNADCRLGTINSLEVYDPQNDTWTARTPMPTARAHTASAVIGGKLYVAGGRGPCPPCPPYSVLEVYDPATDTWDTTRAPLPIAYVAAGGAALDGKFYVAGGGQTHEHEVDGTQYMTVYDPITNRWTIRAPMPTPRDSLGLEAVHGKLYAIGGVTSLGATKIVEAYDPASDVWTTTTPIPNARVFVQPVAINGVIYVVGSGGPENQPIAALEAYIAVCPGSTCVSVPLGLVGWWPGDGNVADLGGSNRGISHGNVKFTHGKVDQAFAFDGASFVSVGIVPAMDALGTQLTMEGWINPQANTTAIYFGKTAYGFNDSLLLFSRGVAAIIRTDGSELACFAYADFPANTTFFVPPINEWTHVAVTYDGATIKIYIDAELAGQLAKSGTIDNDNLPFNIGGRAEDKGTGKFTGLIDEVSVFARALSAEEIRAIFEAGSAGKCKPQAECD